MRKRTRGWRETTCLAVACLCLATAISATCPGAQGETAHEARLDRLRLLFSKEQYGEAITEAQRLLEDHPTGEVLAETLLLKGLCHSKRGERSEALVSLKSLLVLTPESRFTAKAGFTTGLLHLARREPRKARAIFLDLVRRDPASGYARRARRMLNLS